MQTPPLSPGHGASRTRGRLSLFLLACASLVASSCGRAELPEHAEIFWDQWGVPHIHADSELELARGLGWAQMEGHAELLLQLYARARGEAALHFGAAELPGDRWVHRVGIPALAREWIEAQTPTSLARLQAFTSGMNEWAREGETELAEKYRAVLPVTVEDVAAHVVNAFHFTFIVNQRSVAQIGSLEESLPAGSNAWAVAPPLTREGHALLLVNPHLPWGGLFLFFEFQLQGPRGAFHGATLVGVPTGALGFNEHLGWTHTVNPYDGADFFRLTPRTLEDGSEGYLLDGEVRRLERSVQVLRVRADDGSLRDDTLVVERSVHGPIVTRQGGRPLALRVAGLDQPGVLDQWWEMMWVSGLDEMHALLRKLQLPMFNLVYADREGNILQLFNALVPRRGAGDFTTWRFPIDGSRSEHLWNGYHGFDALPRLVNPSSGWLQNANEPPWTMTLPAPFDPAEFPPYLAPGPDEGFGFRPLASLRALANADDLTLEGLLELHGSARSEAADQILDELLELASAAPSDLTRRAGDALAGWDRHYRPGSRGALLFTRWREEYEAGLTRTARQVSRTQAELAQVPATMDLAYRGPSPISPDLLDAPWGLADPETALLVLERTAAQLEEEFGALDVAWGDAVRMRVGEVDLPAHGGPSGETLRVLSAQRGPDGLLQVGAGDSFLMGVEFGPVPRGRAVLLYGNASRPTSPHRGDQLQLYLEGQFREISLARGEAEARAVRHTALGTP